MISVKTVNNVIDAFPIGLYAQPDVLTPEENDILISKVYKLRTVFGAGNTQDWLSGTRSPDNCYKQSNIAEYLEFKPLVERITQCVHELAREHGSDDDYFCTEGWYNIYSSNRYQEYHVHPNSIFSAVYFMKSGDDSQGLHIKRPDYGGMLPPKNKKRDTPFNQEVIIAPPQERTVIIFRSYLEHCVPPSNLKTDRVTVALNFA
tara:strand:- start:177 stop:788 length:612 start_codon:yes stop_codon:yes gene_type:complete